MIIARRLNIGQNIGPDPNAPSLFLIAKDLKNMQVWASVHEADIGRIHEGTLATFSVDAFPKETFAGKVTQIRLDASRVHHYAVIVAFDNSDLKLMPYMTANLKFEIDARKDVLLVPNATLRWKPSAEMMAKGGPVQVEKLEGLDVTIVRGDKDAVQTTIIALSNLSTVTANQKRGIIWVKSQDDKHVRPIEVQTGLTDGSITEISGPDVKEGMEVVIGHAKKTDADSGAVVNPFETKIFRGKQQTVEPESASKVEVAFLDDCDPDYSGPDPHGDGIRLLTADGQEVYMQKGLNKLPNRRR